MSAHKDKLQKLCGHLRDWARWVRGWRPPLGFPTHVPYLHEMRPTVAPDSEDVTGPDPWVMQKVDECVCALKPPILSHAIRIRYLNEIGPAVFRSGRAGKDDIKQLANAAEIKLIPMVEEKGVVLWL